MTHLGGTACDSAGGGDAAPPQRPSSPGVRRETRKPPESVLWILWTIFFVPIVRYLSLR